MARKSIKPPSTIEASSLKKSLKKQPPRQATAKRNSPAADPTFKQLFTGSKCRVSNYLQRRPHRSFRRTRRRDYARSLTLPGYWAFTNEVRRMVWAHKFLFAKLVAVYVGLSAVFIGISSQDTYAQLSEVLTSSSDNIFSGGWGEVGKASLLLASGLTGSFAPQLTELQQLYSALLFLLLWLTTIWLLRVIMTGNARPKLRDGLYNAGAPIVATAIVLLFLLIQIVPAALAFIGVNVAFVTAFLTNGIIGMIFWIVILLLGVLSTYWVSATLMALVIVTLPGMYPWQAMRAAGDLVVGRRIRILLRLAWLGGIVAVVWLLIMVPIIIASNALITWLPALDWIPIVPLAIVVVTSASSVWIATYIYMLYRKVVADDASPA